MWRSGSRRREHRADCDTCIVGCRARESPSFFFMCGAHHYEAVFHRVTPCVEPPPHGIRRRRGSSPPPRPNGPTAKHAMNSPSARGRALSSPGLAPARASPPAHPPPPMPIYLDWNATTPVYPEVAAAARPWLDDPELFGNPSSSHRYGAAPRAAVAAARASVASLVGASDPAEIVFASCGTEADGWVVWGATMAARRRARASSPLPHVVATSVEHPAVLATLDRRENERFGREGKSGASRGGGPHYRPRQYWSRPAPSRSGSRR